MKTILLYIFQVIACSGLLYGYYHWFLRNERFHQYNRFYLLTATLVSLVIPFLKIPVYISGATNGLQKVMIDYNYYLMPEVVVSASNKSHFFDWGQLLIVLYAAIALFLLVRIGMAIARLIKLRLQMPTEILPTVSLIHTDEDDAPFSFFNWIFWNRKIDATATDGVKIMKHEMYHVKQKHSFDIIFMELVCAVVWFNPIFYFIKKELKAVHEFLADEYAADTEEKLYYAEILVFQAIGSCKQQLVNPFFNNQLKRRINMLTTNKNSRHRYLRKILVLPLLAIVAVLFVISCKSNDEKTEKVAPHAEVVPDVPTTAKDTVSAIVTQPQQGSNASADEPEIFSRVEIDAAFPGGPLAWRKFLETNLRGETPVDKGAGPGNYTTIIQFIVDKDGNVSDVKPLTKLGYGMEEEAVRVIRKSGKWKPAIQNGREVKAYRKQPITFQIVEQ